MSNSNPSQLLSECQSQSQSPPTTASKFRLLWSESALREAKAELDLAHQDWLQDCLHDLENGDTGRRFNLKLSESTIDFSCPFTLADLNLEHTPLNPHLSRDGNDGLPTQKQRFLLFSVELNLLVVTVK